MITRLNDSAGLKPGFQIVLCGCELLLELLEPAFETEVEHQFRLRYGLGWELNDCHLLAIGPVSLQPFNDSFG